jgi:transcriptional regulator with XRE-family HTH domain
VDWEETLADIGDRVRAERQARRWSRAELARRAGIAIATAQRLEEHGASTLRVFAQVCGALGMDMGALLSDEWRMPERSACLTSGQVRVLRAVSGGEPLSVVASQLGMPADGLGSRLSEIYRRLDVVHVPRGVERRMAAVDAARKRGLLNAA